MATLNGDNYAKIVSVPNEQLPIGDVCGKKRFAYDEITLAAELAVNDVINVCAPLPANARVVDAGIFCPAMGATGIVDFGYSADQNYFIDQADPGAAAVNKKMASEAGYLAKLASILQPQLKCTELTAAGTGLKIQVWIEFVLE